MGDSDGGWVRREISSSRYIRGMGSAADWLREERRKTLGDWIAVCVACGHGQRYFEGAEEEVEQRCPTCDQVMITRCPACEARISSMFAVTCEECEEPIRAAELFGSPIRRVKPTRK